MRAIRDLVDSIEVSGLTDHSAAASLIDAVADTAGWSEAARLAAQLPRSVADEPDVQERVLLAQAKTGDVQGALDGLLALVDERGGTSERWGLIGGRYKQLWQAARADGDVAATGLLERAIDAYESGSAEDPDDYYPVSNLVGLYLELPEPATRAARLAARLTAAACERALERGDGDEWLRPTLLGQALIAGDETLVRDLVERVKAEGPAAWKVESTLADLDRTLARMAGSDWLAPEPIVAELRSLL